MVISAISTAQGRGGVAIVRMSGEGSLEIAKKMFSRKGEFVPNMMYAGNIDAGSFSDFGMCVYFRGPRSFTGEDTVEFHCHGGYEIARAILARTLQLGARLAERGEFTKRAFLSGKLSLSAAEGMADMINASSLAEVRAGALLYGEKLTAEGKALQAKIRTALAGVEADVDFPEEDLNADSRTQTRGTMSEVEASLCDLLKQYGAGRKIKNGVAVAITGQPNAGKSTLLNALLGFERAIVSDVPGTTRDTVEGTVEIKGVLFRLIDTAGIRESEDEIEREGVRRAEQAISSADLILYLKGEETPAFPEHIPVITVGAKCDIRRTAGCDILVSALTGEGMEALRELMYERGFGAESGETFLLEERHYEAAKRALEATRRAIRAIDEGLPPELYAEDMRAAHAALGEFSGETASDAVIDEIFSKFCVGK